MFSFEHPYENATLLQVDSDTPDQLTLAFQLEPMHRGQRVEVRLHMYGVKCRAVCTEFLDWLYDQHQPRCSCLKVTKSTIRRKQPLLRVLASFETCENCRTCRIHCQSLREEIVASRTSKLTSLTTRYACPRCGQSLRFKDDLTTTGLHRGRGFCPACKVSIYVAATLHRCGACGVLLETPSGSHCGKVNCPKCRHAVIVPESLLFSVDDASLDKEQHFVVECPSCETPQAAWRRDAGRRTVCLACHSEIEIPRHGEGVSRTPSGFPEPTRTCPVCGNHLPTSASVCFVCRSALPLRQG